MTESARRVVWCALVAAASILPATAFAAGAEDTTAPAAAEVMAEAFNYEQAYGTYHWTTPAAFLQATGETVGDYQEAPQLAQLVSAGDLPPVEERLPREPLVLGREIGTYGGTLHLGGGHFAAFQYAGTPYSNYGVGLAEHTWTSGTYPNLVKGWEMHDDGRAYTLHLREGLRYSDGEPFTADDIMFWWNHVVPTGPTFPDLFTRIIISTGLYENVVKIDDYTVRVEYSKPSDNLFWVHFGKAVPAHQKQYFSQFHPDFQDQDKLDEMVKEAGFSSWIELYEHKLDIRGSTNTERPILLAWVLKQVPPDDYILERNPYFWAVDPAGQQLPYLDRIYGFAGAGPGGWLEAEVRDLKAQAGELDFADVPMATYRLVKEREAEGRIRGQRMGGVGLNSAQLSFNLNHKDPRVREIFMDKRFRIAASHALNRERISELVFLGLVPPWQVASNAASDYYHERMAHSYLKYDPDKSRALFDEIGLEVGDDGFRRRLDGEKLQINLLTWDNSRLQSGRIAEMMAEDLQAAGLDINLKIMEPSVVRQTTTANDQDAVVVPGAWTTIEGGFWLGNSATAFVPVHTNGSMHAQLWYEWYESVGAAGEEPPPEMVQVMEWYRAGLSTIDPAERKELWFRIVDVAADNLWVIGTVQHPGYFKVLNANLANYPADTLPWDRGGDKGRPEIWFYRQ